MEMEQSVTSVSSVSENVSMPSSSNTMDTQELNYDSEQTFLDNTDFCSVDFNDCAASFVAKMYSALNSTLTDMQKKHFMHQRATGQNLGLLKGQNIICVE